MVRGETLLRLSLLSFEISFLLSTCPFPLAKKESKSSLSRSSSFLPKRSDADIVPIVIAKIFWRSEVSPFLEESFLLRSCASLHSPYRGVGPTLERLGSRVEQSPQTSSRRSSFRGCSQDPYQFAGTDRLM